MRKAKAEAETAERESSCDEAKDKENCLLERQRAKGGLLGRRPVCDDCAMLALAHNWRNYTPRRN